MKKLFFYTVLISIFFPLFTEAQTLRQRAEEKGVFIGNIMRNEFMNSQNELYNSDGTIKDLDELTPGTDLYNQVNITSNQFNVLELENGMKMDNILAEYNPSTFPEVTVADINTDDIDLFLNYAQKHGMRTRGHALLWYSQAPGWLEDLNPNKQQIYEFMENYITTIVGYCKGRVDEWDVANEVLQAGTNQNGFRTQRTNNEGEVWYARIAGANNVGSELYNTEIRALVANCFTWAANADPDALLFYNDFNIASTDWAKGTAARNFVTDLRAAGAPIDGIGFQCHFITNNFFNDNIVTKVVDNIRLYSNINNDEGEEILVHLTELDIRSQGGTMNGSQVHNAYYSLLSSVYAESNCNLVLIWGVRDSDSWIIPTFQQTPYLLWDGNFNQNGQYNANGSKTEGGWTGAFDSFGALNVASFPPANLPFNDGATDPGNNNNNNNNNNNGAQLIANGTYLIKKASANVYLQASSASNTNSNGNEDDDESKWVVSHLGNNEYEIFNVEYSNSRLEVPYPESGLGAPVGITNWNGTAPNLQWKAESVNGGIRLSPMHDLDFALDIHSNNPNVVHLWEKGNNPNPNQILSFVNVNQGSDQLINNGTYLIKKASANIYLNASNNTSTNSNGNTTANSSKWNVTHLGNDEYEIFNVEYANSRLEVPYPESGLGAPVGITDWDGTAPNIEWKAESVNGGIRLSPLHDLDFAMDLHSNNPGVVHLWEKGNNPNPNQTLSFIPTNGGQAIVTGYNDNESQFQIDIEETELYTSDVNDNNQLNPYSLDDVIIYPVPASTVLHIKGLKSDQINYNIYTMSGKLVKRQTLGASNKIVVSDLHPGLYYLQLISKNNSKILKLYKN